jgi:hypothetical protein
VEIACSCCETLLQMFWETSVFSHSLYTPLLSRRALRTIRSLAVEVELQHGDCVRLGCRPRTESLKADLDRLDLTLLTFSSRVLQLCLPKLNTTTRLLICFLEDLHRSLLVGNQTLCGVVAEAIHDTRGFVIAALSWA